MSRRRSTPSRWPILLVPALFLALPAGAVDSQPGGAFVATVGFRVVVHARNPADSLPAGTISKFFLKRISRWEDGEPVSPVDQGETTPVRKAFSDIVHGKSVSAIKSFWQRMIFSGREVPPSELGSDDDVLAYVRDHRGAIGYVSADTELGKGVKELRVTE